MSVAAEKTPGVLPDPDGEGEVTQASDKATVGGMRVTLFDEKQQRWVEHHGDEMFGKGFKKAEALYESKTMTLDSELRSTKGELETLKTELQAVKAGKPVTQAGKDEQHAEVSRLQATIEEMQGTIKTLKSDKEAAETRVQRATEIERGMTIRSAFQRAIPKGVEFFDVDEALELGQKEGKLELSEHGTVFIVNPRTGNPRIGADGDPMTLTAFVNEIVAKKPYLVKSNLGSGSGGGEARELARETKPPSPADMSKEDFEALKNKVKLGQRIV
jgi:hypothetical protein